MSMSPEEIKAKWRRDAATAANHGTWMHWQCERFLNKMLVDLDTPEMKAFVAFLSSLRGCHAYRIRSTRIAHVMLSVRVG